MNGLVGGEVMSEVTVADREKRPGLMLVRIAQSEPPIYFVIDYPIYSHNIVDGQLDEEYQQYFVEEHTCPTNLIPVERIICGSDTDPHGLLEYVQHVEKPADWDYSQRSYDDLAAIFSRLPGGIVEGKRR